jgi:excinuclease ABC subunit C
VIKDFSNVPSTPGVYQFFDTKEIIYIGKAKVLNQRVRSYFTKSIKDRKTEKIKSQAVRVETFSTHTEAEALILEQQLIKENKPKFNILLRDDKTYPFIHFKSEHPFPSLSLKRNKHPINEDYYGPFVSAKFARQQIKDLQKLFKLRNCSDSTFNNRSRPCIEYQMRRCSAPCVGYIGKNSYLEDVLNAQKFLTSERKQLKKIFKDQMKKYSDKLEFELAEEYKQKIKALELIEQETKISAKSIDLDIFSVAFKNKSTGLALLGVRGGKAQTTRTYFFKEDFKNNLDNLFQRVCFACYQNKSQIAHKLLINAQIRHLKVLEDALSKKFNKKIKILSSKNKHNSQFLRLANLNAEQAIINKLKTNEKYKDHFAEIRKLINTNQINPTLECIDISHHSGGFAKAAVVHFSEKNKEPKNYRTYNIPNELAGNDTGSIEYVVNKRLSKNKVHPSYILIDGGKNQLNAALKARPFNTVTTILSIAKGAKRRRLTETIFTENGQIEVSQTSEAITLLLLARDEAHRFAIKANRFSKQKSMKFSILDRINGIGPRRKEILYKKFKSLKNIMSSSLDEIAELPSFSRRIAKLILEELRK